MKTSRPLCSRCDLHLAVRGYHRCATCRSEIRQARLRARMPLSWKLVDRAIAAFIDGYTGKRVERQQELHSA